MKELFLKYWPWVLGAIAILFFVSQWYGARAELVEMNATLKAKDQQIVQLVDAVKASERRVSDLEERMVQREEETRRQLDALAATARRAQTATPQQIASEISTLLPVQPKLQPTGEITITQQELRDLYATGAHLKAVEIELSAVKADVLDLRATIVEKDLQIGQLKEQVKLVGEQKDAAVKAAKGGGFWRRTGTALKWVAIGIAVGVGISKM